uniref:Uncharacterized protein n=1 Tax=Anguilla anguilla TaxID=7936 RepID=A0A0E9XQN8_ANGAN
MVHKYTCTVLKPVGEPDIFNYLS